MTDVSIQDRIIDYIRRNRVSTTEVADCLDKTGSLVGLRAISPGHFAVGRVSWIYTWEESNWPVHEQAEALQEGTVVLVDAIDCGERAVFGDIVAKYLLLYKQSSALVINGNVRDAHRLMKERWPIWCRGFNPVGCFNRKPENPPDPLQVEAARRQSEGAIAVCDDTGVVLIPPAQQTEEFIGKLEFIEEQEDIWYECIDRRKWSTFKTICLKAYLDKNE
jgi:regulator of RNase E activity RraA